MWRQTRLVLPALCAACAQLGDEPAPPGVAAPEADLRQEAFRGGLGDALAGLEGGGNGAGAAGLDSIGASPKKEGKEGEVSERFVALLVDSPSAAPAEPEPAAAAEDQPQARTWFPESFVWEPRLVTGDDGVAELDVRVPDALTTWRMLGLAHDRDGRQAGVVATFDSSLPLYVEPVVPGWLHAGDRFLLPVQVVNTTASAATGELSVTTSGAASGGGSVALDLAAGGSAVRSLPLVVSGSGEVTFKAMFRSDAGSDAAERSVPVLPVGRPVARVRGGLVSAGSVSFVVSGAEGADPSTEALDVVVHGGPLSVLQDELLRLLAGGDAAPGLGYALAGQVTTLASASAVELDTRLVRRLELLSYQGATRAARNPTSGLATGLLLSLPEGREGPAAELRERLEATVSGAQRGDGTWSTAQRSTVQQVLVETATAARALGPGEPATIRAKGAIERLLREVDDGYTAAVLLSVPGLVDDAADRETLVTLVRGALARDESGVTTVTAAPGVLDAWGAPPSEAQLFAVTALALSSPDDAMSRGDLVSGLLTGWSPRSGFGAGWSDALVLEALARGLTPASGPVALTLKVDGVVAATAAIDPSQPRVPAVMSGVPTAGRVEITADPPTAGLVFVATRRSWVPWGPSDRLAGFEVATTVPALSVGRAGLVHVELSGPSGAAPRLEIPSTLR